MRADRRLLGWGVFFILLGAIPLAVKAGVLDPELVRGWLRLWPVLLIGWGLGLLLRNTPLAVIGGAVTAITFGIMAGGALATGFHGVPTASGCHDTDATTAFAGQSGQLGGSARAEIELACGTLNVTTADGSAWSVAGSDRKGTGPDVTTSGGGVSIRTKEDKALFGSSGNAVWNVMLPKNPSLDLGVTLSAGDGTVNMAGANVASASITLNAGSLAIDLGSAAFVGDVNATVNAGSGALSLPLTPPLNHNREVNLSLNAGSLQVCLPANAPVRVEWSGVVGSNNFDAIGLTKVDDHTWQSSTLNVLASFTELQVSANAGSFELTLGGTCDA